MRNFGGEFPWNDEYPRPDDYASEIRARALEHGVGVALDTLVDARMYADEIQDFLEDSARQLDYLADAPDGVPESFRRDLRETQSEFYAMATWMEVLQEELLKQQGYVRARSDD